jgi:hypothetical protein
MTPKKTASVAVSLIMILALPVVVTGVPLDGAGSADVSVQETTTAMGNETTTAATETTGPEDGLTTEGTEETTTEEDDGPPFDFPTSTPRDDESIPSVGIETEPNDQLSEANPLALDSPVTGEIATPSDVDVYRVTVTQPTAPSLLLETTTTGTFVFGIVSVDETPIAAALASQGQPGEATVEQQLQPGVYYVAVFSYEEDPGTGPYVLSVETERGPAMTSTPTPSGLPPAQTEAEPNDQASQANPLALNSPVAGEIAPPGDRDGYLITLSEPASPTIRMETSAQGPLAFGLVTPSGTILAAGVASQGQPGQATVETPVPPGQYFVLVVASGDAPTTGRYVLTVVTESEAAVTPTPTTSRDLEPVDPDPTEPNDDFRSATLLQSGQTIEASIGSSTDVDMYAIENQRASDLRVEIQRTAGSGAMTYTWIAPDGNEIATRTIAWESSALTLRNTTSGTYYLVLEHANWTGDYTISLTTSGGDGLSSFEFLPEQANETTNASNVSSRPLPTVPVVDAASLVDDGSLAKQVARFVSPETKCIARPALGVE